jgi:hypothetical protein
MSMGRLEWYERIVKPFPGPRVRAALVGAVAALTLAACGSSPAGSTGTSGPTGTATGPSVSALMVCSAEAQADLQNALGVGVARPPDSSFVDGVYTCDYHYAAGELVMSVRDMGDQGTAEAYMASARAKIKKPTDLAGIGDAAFSDGVSQVFVRKDVKVLTVDASKLPATFGQPPHPRSTIAATAAIIVMLCWTGA